MYIERKNNEIIIKDAFFGKSLLVKNAFRFLLKKDKEKFELFAHKEFDEEFKNSKFKDKLINENPSFPSIILLLESPEL